MVMEFEFAGAFLRFGKFFGRWLAVKNWRLDWKRGWVGLLARSLKGG